WKACKCSPRRRSPNYRLACLHLVINLTALRLELLRHMLHFCLDIDEPDFLRGVVDTFTQRSCIVADILCDFHRTEFRSAHRTEMRNFRGLLRQRFIVETARGIRVEAEIELIFP